MAVLDVIEFLDPTGKQIVHRVPEGGSGEFRLGSQAIVRESQVAVFFRDGAHSTCSAPAGTPYPPPISPS